MRLIDEHEVVLREEIHQRRRWISGLATREIHRVVLDPVYKSDLSEHLHVIFGPHFYTFCFDELSDRLEKCHLLLHLMFDPREDVIDDGFARDEVLGREYHDLITLLEGDIGEILSLGDTFQSISEKFKPEKLLTRARPNLKSIPDEVKHTRLKICS